MAVPGRVGQRQVEQRGEPLVDVEAALAERRERAGGAAELHDQRLAAQPLAAARARGRARRIAGELEPERHRQRVLQAGARHRRRCGDGVRRASRRPSIARSRSASSASMRGAQFEHQRGVDHVLRARAPMHERGRVGVGLGDLGGERVDQRQRRCCRRRAPRPPAPRGRSARRWRRRRSDRPRRRGITPTAASARASAASKSSMRCTRAPSSTTARMATLENIGSSRDDGASASVMSDAVMQAVRRHTLSGSMASANPRVRALQRCHVRNRLFPGACRKGLSRCLQARLGYRTESRHGDDDERARCSSPHRARRCGRSSTTPRCSRPASRAASSSTRPPTPNSRRSR